MISIDCQVIHVHGVEVENWTDGLSTDGSNDDGQPCLVPRVMLNADDDMSPPSITCTDMPSWSDFTMWT